MSVLLYNCTTWTRMKYLEKKLNGNLQFYSPSPPISETKTSKTGDEMTNL